MSAPAAARRGAVQVLVARCTGLRGNHPVQVLRWLRNGTLLGVALTALLYLVTADQAHHRITAARHTEQALADIHRASVAAGKAHAALEAIFNKEDVTLTGTGNDFATATAATASALTSAAGGNAAGVLGTSQIQFVQGQLAVCVQMADTAVELFPHLGPAADGEALDALAAPDQTNRSTGARIPDTGGLIAALDDLHDLEQSALHRQRSSAWLEPACVWPLLLGPMVPLLLLAAATSRVLVRHFRRYLSPLLWGALAVTAAVAGTAVVLDTQDSRHLSADPWAWHPATVTTALVLLAGAAVLAHLAYRPRLLEYRFPS